MRRLKPLIEDLLSLKNLNSSLSNMVRLFSSFVESAKAEEYLKFKGISLKLPQKAKPTYLTSRGVALAKGIKMNKQNSKNIAFFIVYIPRSCFLKPNPV
jgi:hypothetical protein